MALNYRCYCIAFSPKEAVSESHQGLTDLCIPAARGNKNEQDDLGAPQLFQTYLHVATLAQSLMEIVSIMSQDTRLLFVWNMAVSL